MQQQHQQSRNTSKATRVLSRGMPDETMHESPAAMAVIGWMGVLAGGVASLWQMYTTISAVYQMFTGSSTPVLDPRNVTFDICFLIAFSFQLALLFLVFLYAVALYALSTLAFVRSIEYLWAASAVKDQWERARARNFPVGKPKF